MSKPAPMSNPLEQQRSGLPRPRPGFPSAAALGASRAALALLVLAVLLLPFERLQVTRLFGHGLVAADMAFVLALAAWMASLVLGLRMPRWTRAHSWIAAYVVLLGGSILASPHFIESLGKWLGVLYLALIALLAASLAEDRRAFKFVALAWVLTACLAALLSLLAIVAFYVAPGEWPVQALYYHYGSLPPGPYPRVRSLFVNVNAYATFLIPSMAMLLIAWQQGWVGRRLAIAGLAVMLVAALATVSPVLGPLGLFLGAWAFTRCRRRQPRLATGLLGVGAALMVASLFVVAVNPTPPFSEPSVRVNIWSDAVDTVRSAPLTGAGLGQPVVRRETTVASGARQFHTDAHNLWLSIAGQSGLLAAAAITGLMWVLLAGAWRAPADSVRLTLGLSLFGGLVLAGLTGSFEDERHLWLLMGLLLARISAAVAPPTTASLSSRS